MTSGNFNHGYYPNTGFKKGHIGYTPKQTEEHKRKKNLACSIAMKGKHSSPKTEFKKGENTKERNINWKGGLTKLQKLELKAGRKRPENCEICGIPQTQHTQHKKGLYFDHDHKTGEFRGWICIRCNFALGYAKDNVEILKRMIDYLT